MLEERDTSHVLEPPLRLLAEETMDQVSREQDRKRWNFHRGTGRL